MASVLRLNPQYPLARRDRLNDNAPEVPEPPHRAQLRVVTLCGSCRYLAEGEVGETGEPAATTISCRLKAKPLQPKTRCNLFIEAPPKKAKKEKVKNTFKKKVRKSKKKK